jgi:hypothetical protein
MDDGIETARFQWTEGERRLAEAASDRETLEMVTQRIIEELRRRLGGPFMAAELSELYSRGTDWCMQVALAAAPSTPAAWDEATVADAAFGKYLREATDYAGGRIVSPFDE